MGIITRQQYLFTALSLLDRVNRVKCKPMRISWKCHSYAKVPRLISRFLLSELANRSVLWTAFVFFLRLQLAFSVKFTIAQNLFMRSNFVVNICSCFFACCPVSSCGLKNYSGTFETCYLISNSKRGVFLVVSREN